MPTFEITSPDGRKFRVTAPEGATQDDAINYVRNQQQQPAAAAPKPEVEDPGAFGAGVIGAGRAMDRLVQGVKQGYYGLRGDEAALAKQKADEDANTRIYAGLQRKRPIATTLGEIAPLVAALPAVGGIGSAAALGAIPGAVEYGTPEEKLLRAGLGGAGGAAGAGLGKLAGRIAQPFRPTPTQTQTAAQAAAQRLGVQLRPGEITQSTPLRWAEASLNDLPFAGGMAQKAEQARREAINAAGARSIGQNATELTEGVLAQARTEIGQVFDNLLPATKKIELGPRFRTEMRGIIDSKVMKELQDQSVQDLIAPFQNMPAGRINVSGDWFQQNKTALDAAIRGAYNSGQNGKAIALEKFEKALINAAKDSMSTTERAAYDAAQRQWANLRLLETGKVVESGNLIPNRLDTALINRYKSAYKEGKLKGELPDIGKLAQAYKPLPQSGTTPRAIYSGMAGGAMLANPAATAAALSIPPALQKFLQSKAGREYLTRGLLNITPEIDKRLGQAGLGLLGLPGSAAID